MTRMDFPDGTVVADVIGTPHEQTMGRPTNMAASQGEDWMVPCDRGGQDFVDWLEEYDAGRSGTVPALKAMRAAWEASRQRHTAKLRRVGWLDQKGRVWTQVPASADFDGGSLTPLLIDVREDSP